MAEIWKPVKGFEGIYEVSNMGNVKALDRVSVFEGRWGKTHRKLKGKNLKPQKQSNGYLTVNLGKGKRGSIATKTIHRLVAEAFIDNPENLPLVLHGNNNKTCNEVWNLRWGTISENTKQAYDDGLIPNIGLLGEKSMVSKYSDSLVKEIKERILSGEYHIDLAKEYGVPRQTTRHWCRQLEASGEKAKER